MVDNNIEERLARSEAQVVDLNKKLEELSYRNLRALEDHLVMIFKVELRLEEVEAKLSDFREVERIAQEAYFKTHPEALTIIREVDDAVDTARRQHYFSTLPTIKDQKDRDSGAES
jgi:hypothetical protein